MGIARYPELVMVGKGSGLVVKTREEGKVGALIFDAGKGGFFATALLMATYGGASGKKWAFSAGSRDTRNLA
jgi:hypothetical protein